MDKYNLWIEVDLVKLRNNLRKAKEFIAGDVGVMAIVKANAYGHGMLEVAHALAEDVNYFGVSSFTEGDKLRKGGILSPILILSSILPYEMGVAIEEDHTLTISEIGYARAVNVHGEGKRKNVKVHIKVDTGMGRWGLPYRDAFAQIKEICRFPFLNVEGIFTHFTVADNEHLDYTDRQIELFKALRDELAAAKITFKYVHAANSAGIINFRESHFNLVRPGIMIYGYYPQEYLHKKLDLEQALSLKGRISLIKEFGPRRGVSYGRKFVTTQHTKIGIVPIGYSHGYPYALSQKAHVLIKGKRYPVAGSVCMDYSMIDLGEADDIMVGDEAILLGQSGSETINAYELAAEANTIPYEIITSLNTQIPRVYINEI